MFCLSHHHNNQVSETCKCAGCNGSCSQVTITLSLLLKVAASTYSEDTDKRSTSNALSAGPSMQNLGALKGWDVISRSLKQHN